LKLGKTAADRSALESLGGVEFIISIVQRNFSKWEEAYRKGGNNPIKFDRGTDGLPRTLLFYSPTQIYLIENSHKENGDLPVCSGSVKLVNKAWEIVSGEKKVIGSMSSLPRNGGDHAICPVEERRYWIEATARSVLKGKPGVVHTEADFRYTSSKTGAKKIWIIEPRYDMDLAYAIMGKDGYSLTSEEEKSIARQIVVGMRSIHDAYLLHRDIKPENMLVRRTPEGIEAVIADFDAALLPETIFQSVLKCDEEIAFRHHFSHKLCVVGTPMYWSPEYAEAVEALKGSTDRAVFASRIVPVTCRASDLYSLGVALFALFNKTIVKPDALHEYQDRILDQEPLVNLMEGLLDPAVVTRAAWKGFWSVEGATYLDDLVAKAFPTP